jgi:hypothetical protein
MVLSGTDLDKAQLDQCRARPRPISDPLSRDCRSRRDGEAGKETMIARRRLRSPAKAARLASKDLLLGYARVSRGDDQTNIFAGLGTRGCRLPAYFRGGCVWRALGSAGAASHARPVTRGRYRRRLEARSLVAFAERRVAHHERIGKAGAGFPNRHRRRHYSRLGRRSPFYRCSRSTPRHFRELPRCHLHASLSNHHLVARDTIIIALARQPESRIGTRPIQKPEFSQGKTHTGWSSQSRTAVPVGGRRAGAGPPGVGSLGACCPAPAHLPAPGCEPLVTPRRAGWRARSGAARASDRAECPVRAERAGGGQRAVLCPAARADEDAVQMRLAPPPPWHGWRGAEASRLDPLACPGGRQEGRLGGLGEALDFADRVGAHGRGRTPGRGAAAAVGHRHGAQLAPT